MKTQVKKFEPRGFYCLCGNSTANSLFFEDAEDQRLFLRLLERFMGKLIDLQGFSTNATGWTLFFVVKDVSTIRKTYWQFKSRSKKLKHKNRIEDPGIMISEHFRYFLSSYVKQSNFRHGRHGARVHSKMEKYVFERLEDMEAEIRSMAEMKETRVQRTKYRPNMAYYLVDLQLKRNSVWRHSFVGLDGRKLVQAVIPCYRYMLDKLEVLRQLIQDTWNRHFNPNNPQNPPPYSNNPSFRYQPQPFF